MIDRLTGTVLATEPGALVLEVGGVGFRLEVTPGCEERFGLLGSRCTVLTIMTLVGSNDPQLRLFGFPSPEARSLFRLLRGVSGIGPNTALRLLGAQQTPGDVAAAIAREDVHAIRVKGVGPKIAKRVVTELKDRVGEILACLPSAVHKRPGRPKADPAVEDAFLALRGLEIDPQRARQLIEEVRSELGEVSADELVRAALIRH